MASNHKGITLKMIEDAMQAKAGNVSEAARALGCTRRNLWARIARTPYLRGLIEDEREALVDLAESSLRESVRGREGWAVIWTLKASPEAKRRGWGERREITGADGGPVQTEDVSLDDEQRVARLSTILDAVRARGSGPPDSESDASLVEGGPT